MIAARPSVRRSPPDGSMGALGVGAVSVVLTIGGAVVVALAGTALVGGPAPLLLWRATVRVLLDLSAAAVLGVLAVLLLQTGPALRHRLLDIAALAAGIWTVTAATTAFLLYLGQAPALTSPSFGSGLVSFLADVVPGRTWLLATVLAAVLSAGLVAVRSRRGLQLLTLLAVGALVPVAAQSTVSDQSLAGTREAGTAAFVLVVALSTWIGAAAVAAVLRSPGSAASRRSVLAVVCGVATLAGLALGGLPSTALTAAVGVVLLLATLAAASRGGRHAFAPAQLVLLGCAVGLAAAARGTGSAPGSTGPRTTPAQILTGAPLPPVPTLGRLVLGWQPDALWLLLGAGLLLGYLDRVIRLRRSGMPWRTVRTVCWIVGVLLLVWLTCGGPAEYAPVLLSVHLAQHAALVAVVPVLLAGGAPRLLLAGGGSRSAVGKPAGPLGHPVVGAALVAAAFLALYGTGLLRWSVTDAVGTEEATLQCLLTGALLLQAVWNGTRRTGVLVLVALLVVETLAAAGPAFGPGLLLADWFGAMGWGTDALVDQRLGALLAWGIVVVTTLVLLVATVRRRAGSPPPARVDAGAASGLEVSA